VGASANSLYAAEDAAAATSLTPAAGSFLAGKTAVALLGSTAPANGDLNPYAIWPVTRTIGSVTKGPTGLAVGSAGTLYVANNLGNAVDAVPDALTRGTSDGTGTVLASGGQLANPLGLAVAPDGDLLAANAANGKIVEITPAGKQVGEYYADDDIGQEPPGDGDLFDVAVDPSDNGILFVNDGTNTLEMLR
jgi:sugar lactone lactonase YvrE